LTEFANGSRRILYNGKEALKGLQSLPKWK